MKFYILALLVLGISCVLQGIDVSTYQQTITWSTVAKNNHFAIIRAGYGFGHIDDHYETNYKNAKAAGVKVGAYWYSYAGSVSDAKQEANYCIQAIKGKQFEWPIYYDIEENSIFNKGIASDIAKAFCEVLEANKYYCGIYSSAGAFKSYFNNYVKEKFTIWVAHWDVSKPSYSGTYGLWQYKVGYTAGISGQVDLDYGYIDFEPIIKQYHLNGF
jgi:GH25 family lysozyme M1 (1,4-beta-N-acetylmuramidase)